MLTGARQFHSIARLTFLEVVRQPITLLLITTGLVSTAALPVLVSHTLGESAKVIADSVLAVHLLFGMLLGAFSASATLSGEMHRGTAATVLSKPVGRSLFFLAKYAGVAWIILLYSVLQALALLLSVRTVAESFTLDPWGAVPLALAIVLAYALGGLVNYFGRRPFPSSAVYSLAGLLAVAFLLSALNLPAREGVTHWTQTFSWNLAPAAALVTIALLVLAALALALSTRLALVPTITACSLIFFAGLVSDYLFGRRAATDAWAAALYSILPNWQHFWLADAVHEGQHIPLSYIVHSLVYAGLYLSGILCLGAVSFRHAEVKA